VDKFGNLVEDVKQNLIALQVTSNIASAAVVEVVETLVTLKTIC
jgi:hypothetical protein